VTDTLLIKSIVVIAASFAAVGVFVRLRLPPILGYLFAGIAIGPLGLQILGVSPETTFLAELGVIFLMFMAGLEMSLPALLEARRDVLGAGSLQVGLTTLAVMAAALLAGYGLTQAFVLGGTVAMSSTALTVRQITSQGQLSSRYGRLSLGILLFQDIATLPFLVAIASWAQGTAPQPWEAAKQFLTAFIALGGIIFVCRPIFRAMLSAIARLKSPELFLLAVLLLALGTAFAVNLAGLAPPIGAFLAGMVVGESDFRHQIEDDIRPFRDVLVGLFFITVGMEIDPAVIITAPLAVLAWLTAFIPVKASLVALTGLIMRWPRPDLGRISIVLAHGGEIGLLLLTQAVHAGIIPANVGEPALFALAVSMGAAPILIEHNGAFARLLAGQSQRISASDEETTARDATRNLKNHVLICGCGRVGRLVALVLEAAKVPYVAIEHDVERFIAAKRAGHNVVFGDATRKGLLEAAGMARARVILITFDHDLALKRLLHHARQENPKAATIVSAADDRNLPMLAESGASTVYPESFAVGLGLADQVLLLSGLSRDKAAQAITAVRSQLNPELGGRVGI